MKKISISEITKLRKETGAAVMACKKALQEAKGDFALAKQILKKEGLAIAAKKADRKTEAGIIESYVHLAGRVGVLVKLVCETDFVARTEDFKKLAHEICLQVASMNPKDVKLLLVQEYIREPGKTVEDLIKETVAKVGENIRIVDFKRLEI